MYWSKPQGIVVLDGQSFLEESWRLVVISQ
jgi:hypothetical protein